MNLTGLKVMNPLPDHNRDTELADEFTQFFITQIDTITKKSTNIALYALQDSNIPRLWKFDTVSEEDFKRIIMSIKSMSCELKLDTDHTSQRHATNIAAIADRNNEQIID